MKKQQFVKFASEINDVFGTIDRISRVTNDDLMEVENEILDDPNFDLETEKERIRVEVAKKVKGVLNQFGLE